MTVYGKGKRGLVEEFGALRTRLDKLESRNAELIQIQETLQESVNQFKTIFDNTMVGLYRTTPDGQILMANTALLKMLGYSSFDQLAQRNLEKEGYEPQYPRSAFKECIESEGAVIGLESAWLRSDGATLYVRESAQAVCDEQENTLYYLGTIEDITERKRAEEALRTSEEKFRTLVTSLGEGVDIVDENLRCLFTNPAGEKIFGVKPGGLVGRTLHEFISDKAHRVVEEQLTKRRKGVTSSYDLEITRPDGQKRQLIITGTPRFSEDGEFEGALATFFDVTKRKQAEENLRKAHSELEMRIQERTAELQQANEALQAQIAERINAEDELKKSNDILEKTFSSLDSAIFTLDANKPPVIIDCNPAATIIFGYEKGEIIGKTTEFLHISKETMREFQKALNRSIQEQGGLSFFEFKMQRKDGQVFPSEHSVRSLKDDEGRIIGWVSVVRDITERKQSEQALRETTNLLETIFEHTHMLVACLDPQFNFVRVNRAYADADERQPSFFHGKNHFDLYPNKENEVIFRRVVETGIPYFANAKPFEYAEHPERGISYWDWSLVPIKNQQGIVSGLVLTLVDVTARKRAEEALQASQGKLNAMFQSIGDHMSLMDEDLNVIWANEKAMNIFGDDIVGRKCYEAYHGRNEPCEPHPCLTLKAFQDGKVHEHDTQVVDKDGNTRYFHCSANVALRDSEGKPTAVLEISRDITDQKRVEQALRESESSYRAVVENAAEGIIVVQGQTLQFVNPALVSMVGYSKEELLTRPFIEFVHPEHRDWAMGIHIKRLKGEEVPPAYEFKVLDKKGNVKWLENNGILIEWRDKPATLNFIRDVTERKKAEQAIWASESEKKSILNAISDHIIFHDTDLLIRWGNEAAARSIGMTQRELIGRYCYELWQGRSEPCERCPVIRAIETGSYDAGIMTTPDGKWWEIIGEPVLDRDGQIRGAIEISRDITERKRAEQALRESEERLKILFESAPDTIYLIDSEGRFVDGNRAAMELIGFAKDEVIGKSLAEIGLLSAGQLSKAKANLKKAVTGELSSPNEYTLKRKDGTYVSVEVRTFPVKIGGKMLTLGIARDITEHKQAEEAVREERDKAQKYLDIAAVMFIALDGQGNVTLVNERGCELLGWDEPEIVGKNWFENFLPENIKEQVKAVFPELIAGNNEPVEYYENPILCKDGSQKIIAWHNTALKDGSGNIIGTLSSGQDITERKQAEKKLLDHQAQLKSLASELSLAEERERHRLATELHDQISQSLVISKIKLDQLRKSSSSDEFKEPLEDISNCLGKIVDDTRTLTFDLSYPILYELGFEAAVSEWLADEIREKHGIETEFENDGQLKPLDEDIRILLFRDVRELLVNIVKHAQAHKVKVSVRRVDGHIHVSVEDDGVGFDPVEVTSTAAQKAKFGFFSIRERLEQLGGLIEIESEPGHGSKITMTAPLKNEGESGGV